MTLDTFLADLSNTPPDTPVVVLLGDNHENIVASDLQKAFGVATVLYQAKVSNQGRGANLRSSPGMSNNVIRLLPDGTLLDVLSTSIVTIAPYNWVYVRIASSGAPGWIALPLIARVVPPVPTLRKLIGLHVLQDGASHARDFWGGLPAGTKLPSVTILNDAASATWWVTRANYVICRNTPTENLTIPTDNAEATTYARSWLAANVAWISALPNGAYLQVANEISYAPGHSGFWLGIMQGLDAIGGKAAIGAYSVGTPEPSDWQALLPALQYATLHGHIVCLHAYCKDGTPAGQLSDAADQQYFEMRFARLYDAVPSYAQPKLVISEFAGQFKTGQFQGTDALLKVADAYQAALEPYPYVAGFNLWTVGSLGGWAASSIDSALSALATYITRGHL